MIDFIAGGIALLIIGAALVYIIKAKKKGVKCIGCPAAGSCGGQHGGASGCSCQTAKK